VLLPCLCPFASSVLFGFPLFSVMFLFWVFCLALPCVIFQCLRSSFFSACSPLATAASLGFYRRFGSLCPRLLMIITAWELVSCKDADTNSPATGGLLAVDFGPDSSSVPGRKSASIEDFGRLNWSVLACVGLPIWAAFRFFFTGGVLCVQRKKTINGGETTPFPGEGDRFSIWSSMF